MHYPAQFIGTPIEPRDELKLLACYPHEDRSVREMCAVTSYMLQLILDFDAASPFTPEERRMCAVAARGLAIGAGHPHGVPDAAVLRSGAAYLVDGLNLVAAYWHDIAVLLRVNNVNMCVSDRCRYAYHGLASLPGAPWRLRERARLAEGSYAPAPWHEAIPEIEDHFVHLARDAEGMIAFTESADKGARDIQTRMKPGRYLAKFYPSMNADEVRKWAALVDQQGQVLFAVTADEIENIYRTGPDSCMAKRPDAYTANTHPVRAYGDSDFQLAYMIGRNGKPSARTLVDPNKKRYIRIYGDEGRLRPKLEALGYSRGSCIGSRIKLIKLPYDQILMPYLDSTRYVRVVDKEWLALCNSHDDGSLYTGEQNTSGAIEHEGESDEDNSVYCPHCEEYYDDNDGFETVRFSQGGNDQWCASCIDNDTTACDRTERRYPDDEVQSVIVGESLAETWANPTIDRHAYECEHDGNFYSRSDCPPVTLEDGQTWNPFAFRDEGARIEGVNYAAEGIPDELIKAYCEAATSTHITRDLVTAVRAAAGVEATR